MTTTQTICLTVIICWVLTLVVVFQTLEKFEGTVVEIGAKRIEVK